MRLVLTDRDKPRAWHVSGPRTGLANPNGGGQPLTLLLVLLEDDADYRSHLADEAGEKMSFDLVLSVPDRSPRANVYFTVLPQRGRIR